MEMTSVRKGDLVHLNKFTGDTIVIIGTLSDNIEVDGFCSVKTKGNQPSKIKFKCTQIIDDNRFDTENDSYYIRKIK